MWKGKVLAIHIAGKEGDPLVPVEEVRAVAGLGLEGDRNYHRRAAGRGRPAQEVTLIESEALEALAHDCGIHLSAAESRRNILTAGVPLNDLVGRRFRVGESVLQGVELSEPCGYLERMTKKGVAKGLAHRGGLRAEILIGGTLRPGDPIEMLPLPDARA